MLLALAKKGSYEFTANDLRQELKHIHNILPNPVEIDNLTLTEYTCTRNASYTGNCSGRDGITPRQEYYIPAHTEEEACQQMAARYPKETAAGFTVQHWSANSGRSVVILRSQRDEAALEVLVNQEGKRAITNDEGDVIGCED